MRLVRLEQAERSLRRTIPDDLQGDCAEFKVYHFTNGLASGRIIYTRELHGTTWMRHASMVCRDGKLPTWDQLKEMAATLMPSLSTWQLVQAGPDDGGWISVHDTCLHVWAREDGKALL